MSSKATSFAFPHPSMPHVPLVVQNMLVLPQNAHTAPPQVKTTQSLITKKQDESHKTPAQKSACHHWPPVHCFPQDRNYMSRSHNPAKLGPWVCFLGGPPLPPGPHGHLWSTKGSVTLRVSLFTEISHIYRTCQAVLFITNSPS